MKNVMEESNLSFVEWNLNYGSSDSVKPAIFVPKYIKGCDVGILTEVRANEYLMRMIIDMGDYDVICSDDQGKYSNQIVILARKELGLSKDKGSLVLEVAPDFLHGRITVREKIVNIIGFRVKIGGSASYADRFEQFKALKKYLDSLEGEKVICAGDANSGQIRGNSEDNYDAVRLLYQYRYNKELSDLRFYNWHMIKEELGDQYVIKELMAEDSSWGLSERNGALLYGLGARIKNDLLFYSKDIEGYGEYSWDHVRENEGEYLNMFAKNRSRRGNKIEHGFPDHARLIASLRV